MPSSSIPTAQGAAPAVLMLGAGGPRLATQTVEWLGPFTPCETMFILDGLFKVMPETATVTVSQGQCDSLAATDPVWWVIVG